jgi:hypothetical protein
MAIFLCSTKNIYVCSTLAYVHIVRAIALETGLGVRAVSRSLQIDCGRVVGWTCRACFPKCRIRFFLTLNQPSMQAEIE